MTAYSKVIWSEGLFLRPHHFQQQDRYFERYIEGRCQALASHTWGFSELEIERDLLAIGKLALRHAAGVFPDGTPFRMPEDCALPPPLDVDPTRRDVRVHLAIPLRRAGAPEIERNDGAPDLVRHEAHEVEARDATATGSEVALLEVGAVRTRLIFEPDVTGAYGCIPVAHVVEAAADRHVRLDEGFIPTVLDVHAASRLNTFMAELLGMLHHRGDVLSARISGHTRGTTSEVGDLLALQVINRLEPTLAHFVSGGVVHPDTLFGFCVAAVGELSTYASEQRRPPGLPPYRHDRLRESFDEVIAALRRLFQRVSDPAAVAVPVDPRPFGVYHATPADPSQFSSAAFVLAARADMPADELRQRFPAQLKIGPVDRLRELVTLQLPGVPVHLMPTAPRQLPYHAGFVYFEIDQRHPLWAALTASGAIGMHVAGDFPGLDVEMWAIRTPRETER